MKLKYVEDLLAEAEAVTPREIQEAAELQRGTIPSREDFVGILPENLQKLSVVIRQRSEEIRKFIYAEMPKSSANALEEERRLMNLLAKAEFLKRRMGALADFFWEAVCAEFDVTEDGLAINRKWEVYFRYPRCKDCGKRHPKDSEPGAKDPGLEELFGAMSRNPGVFFGRGGNA